MGFFSERLQLGIGKRWRLGLGFFGFAVMLLNFPFRESSNNSGRRVNAFPEELSFDVFGVWFERRLRRWELRRRDY